MHLKAEECAIHFYMALILQTYCKWTNPAREPMSTCIRTITNWALIRKLYTIQTGLAFFISKHSTDLMTNYI